VTLKFLTFYSKIRITTFKQNINKKLSYIQMFTLNKIYLLRSLQVFITYSAR